MFDEPKRKPKRKRKRDESIIPYVAIFGVVILVIVGAAAAYFLMQSPQEACLEPGPECSFATPTPVPFSLYPTVTPAMPPEMIGQYPSNGETPAISSLALAPDEQHLLVGLRYPHNSEVLGRVASVSLNEVEDGFLALDEEVASYPLISSALRMVDDIDVHPEEAFFSLASITNQSVEIYHYDASELADAVPNEANSPISYSWYSDMAFSPDGMMYAMAGDSGVSLRDTESLVELARSESPDEPLVADIAFNSTSTVLAVAHSETMTNNMSPYVRLWNVEDGQLTELTTVSYSRHILDIAFHPTLNQIAVAMPGQIAIYDLDEEKYETYPISETPAITTITYHPSGGILAFGGSHDAVSGSLYAMPLDDDGFAIFTDEQININNMGFTSGPVSTLVYSATGRTLFVGTSNGGLYAWDVSVIRPGDQHLFE